MTKKLHFNIATVFSLGYSPIAPGTVGSLAGLALCLLLHGNNILYIITFFILFFAGVISAGKVEKETATEDPSFVVIDEFACIFLAFLFIPITLPTVIAGFIIYRVIDIIKVPPLGRLEDIKGGWGIMLDDLMAGIYTNLILQVGLKIFS